jgi:hypothetical protein
MSVWFLAAGFTATFLGGFYYRRAEKYVLASLPVWGRLSANVNTFVNDARTPEKLAHEVANFALLAGCGCFTTGFLMEFLSQSIRRKRLHVVVPDELKSLSYDQKELLGRIMRDLLLYDSLRAPFLGFLMRRALNSFAPPDLKTSKVGWSRVSVLVRSAEKVADRKPPASQFGGFLAAA